MDRMNSLALVAARDRLRLLHRLLRFLSELVELNHFYSGGGRAFSTPTIQPCTRLALDFNLNLSRFGGLLLGQFYGENAIFEFGDDLFSVDGSRNRETAHERAVAALDAMISPGRFVPFEFALAFQGEGLI